MPLFKNFQRINEVLRTTLDTLLQPGLQLYLQRKKTPLTDLLALLACTHLCCSVVEACPTCPRSCNMWQHSITFVHIGSQHTMNTANGCHLTLDCSSCRLNSAVPALPLRTNMPAAKPLPYEYIKMVAFSRFAPFASIREANAIPSEAADRQMQVSR